MSQQKEISSTEKLLELIRRKKAPSPVSAVKDSAVAPEETVSPSASPQAEGSPAVKAGKPERIKSAFSLKSFSANVLTFQKESTVGVDIGHDDLRMVMAVRSENRWRLPALKTTPIPQHLSRESNDFTQYLKRELSAFIGGQSCRLWAIVSAAQVEIRHLRIPKVPKKQIEDVVYWSVKKEFSFDEKTSILDFEVLSEVVDQGIAKISVMVYIAPRQLADHLKGLFAKAGYTLAGISITPFAIQNLFRSGWISTAAETIACLHVGFSYSRIDIFARGGLTMTRDIKTGTNSMVESFSDQYNEKTRRELPGEPAAISMEEARKAVYSISPDAQQLHEEEKGYGLSKEEIFAMILPALERLVRQVERTFEYYTGPMGHAKIERIYVSGAIDTSMKIVEYVSSQLGMDASPLDPLGEQAPAYYKEGRGIPAIAERMSYGPALGIALGAETGLPNLLFTYRDREIAASVKRINRNIFAGFMLIVLLCAGIFTYQQYAIAQKKTVLAGLDHQLVQFHPRLSKSMIMEASAKTLRRGASARDIRNRYLGMALIGELSALTAPNIQFIRLKLNLAAAPAAAVRDSAGAPAKPEPVASVEQNVEIEGLITGERSILETTLAGYAMALKSSPMFKQVVVQKNVIEPLKGGQVLYFIIQMKVG